jgi:hypothetical protein
VCYERVIVQSSVLHFILLVVQSCRDAKFVGSGLGSGRQLSGTELHGCLDCIHVSIISHKLNKSTSVIGRTDQF